MALLCADSIISCSHVYVQTDLEPFNVFKRRLLVVACDTAGLKFRPPKRTSHQYCSSGWPADTLPTKKVRCQISISIPVADQFSQLTSFPTLNLLRTHLKL